MASATDPDTRPGPRPARPANPAPTARGLSDIVIHGAREHNLQNLTLRLPRQSLIVVTGVSGSGKSSLAFDTLYAEGQRRYVESLSAYARQWVQHCPKCDTVMARQSVQEMVDQLATRHAGEKVALLAPLVRGRKGEYRKELEAIRRQGYVRARIDGAWVELDEPPKLARYKRHDIEIVIDRMTVEPRNLTRVADSLEAALKLGNGLVAVAREGRKDLLFSQGAACPNC